jgi:uncharacterized protein YqeY
MSLSESIQADLIAAMRAKDVLRLGALRMVKAAIKNKEVEIRQTLSDSEVQTVLLSLLKQRRDSAEQFRNGGRDEMALKEEAEIQVIEGYLPAPATQDEIRAAIVSAIEDTGASSQQDMGRVIKAARDRLEGRIIDGKQVSMLVKQALQPK